MKIDNFSLLCGTPIIFDEIIVKQPTLYEIATIGEEKFFSYLNIFFLEPEDLKDSELVEKYKNLSKTKFLTALILSDINFLYEINSIFMITLDNYLLTINPETIELELVKSEGESIKSIILNDEKLNNICEIFIKIFCLPPIKREKKKKKTKLEEIQEKLEKSRKTISKIKEKKYESNNKSNFSNYVSVVSIGNHIPISTIIKEYTVYQLINQLRRFDKYSEFNIQIKAALAGAKQEIISWTESLEK